MRLPEGVWQNLKSECSLPMKMTNDRSQGQSGTTRLNDLSIPQQGIVALETLHPQNPALNVASGLRLRGPVDSEKIAVAVRDVFEQYDVLRVNVCRGNPTQAVLSNAKPTFSSQDLESSAQDREAKLIHLAMEESRRPFDIYTGPLLRVALWRLSSSDHVLLLVAHRLICDQISLEVLLREIGQRYANTQRLVPGLGYAEFIANEAAPSDEEISFWKSCLADAPPSLDVGTDYPRPAQRSLKGEVQAFPIAGPLVARLRDLATAQGTTLHAALLAAFKVFLSRYSRQTDVVVGTPISGRSPAALEEVVGPVENMIALRTDLSGEPSFLDVLTRVSDRLEKASSHGNVRFETLINKLRVQRDLSRSPLFQVEFQVRRQPGEQVWTDNIVATPFEPATGTELFDLSMDLIESGDSMEGKLSYCSDLWEPPTVARMAGHFTILLSALVASPTKPISQIPMMSDSERQSLLTNFSSNSTEYRSDFCIHDFFEQQVQRTPRANAVIDGDEQLTYSELNSRANQLAHYLRKEGVRPESLVALCLERSSRLLITILAILKAGGAYVPLDPAYPKGRLAAILEDAKASLLVTEHRVIEALPENSTRTLEWDSIASLLSDHPTTNPPHDVRSENLDYVLFTSGSTGRPKGVALEHKSGAVFVQWAKDVFQPEELAGTLFATSICFDLSVFEIFVPLSVGGTVIIAPNALGLPTLPQANKVTLINTVPSAIAELLRMKAISKSVQTVNLAGEALPNDLAQQIYRETKVARLYNLYGPTEDTTYSTWTLVPRNGKVTIGRPLPNTQAYILDEHLQPVPIGVPGELYLAGDGLARGYWGREDLTKERFVPNVFSTRSGACMYRTGDLARFLADGNIDYMGRIDGQVKLRGFRIELGEIEAVLAKHPSVQYAVATVREDIPGEKRLVAYIVPSGDSSSPALLREFVSKELPGYMVPSAFVEIEALPLSPNGKINRKALPVPDWTRLASGAAAEPKDQIEVALVEIWRNAFGIPNIGITDNFFDLGGDSLKAARVLTEAESLTGREIPLSVLFRNATIEALAQFIRERGHEADPVILEIQEGDSERIPFFAIVPPGEEALGYAILARYMGKQQPVFKIQGHSPITNGKRPYTSEEMEALTEEYVAAIKTVQPQGPYCLGGMCDGTHIAEQLVLRLEAQGDEVGFFAIFDTWVLQHSQRRWLWTLDCYRQRLRQMNSLGLAQQFSRLKRIGKRKVQTLIKQAAPRTDWEETYWPKDFVPARFHSPVIIFKRPKQPFYYIDDREMGWGSRTLSGVEIYEVDFHHLEILREPHVRIFGEKIVEHISKVMRRRKLDSSLTVEPTMALRDAHTSSS
jgi:amino acid adenylation domain-containing protein